MKTRQLVRIATGTLLTLGVIALGARWSSPLSVQAQDNHSNNDDNESSLVRIGFEIAPVPLNLTGRDPWKVGFGSFLVNAVGDCNGCHTGGGPPNFNYAAGGNPYFGQPTKTDPTTYLEGGTDFGPAVPPVPDVYPPPDYWLASGPYVGPDIITRNLTPDHTGLPEGGHSFGDFLTIMRTGKDFDHLHPNCSGAPTPTTNCYFSVPGNEIDGDLLQIMPWPTFSNMTDHQLLAIWTYLSAIPCNANKNSPYPWLRNVC